MSKNNNNQYDFVDHLNSLDHKASDDLTANTMLQNNYFEANFDKDKGPEGPVYVNYSKLNDHSVKAFGDAEDFPSKADQSLLGAPSKFLNDAEVYGEISNEILKTPVQIGFSDHGFHSSRWENHKAKDFSELLEGCFSKHLEGDKDGSAFLQGICLDGQRKKETMVQMHLLGIDCDAGDDLDNVLVRCRELNLFCIAYTTHSHGKKFTDIPIKQMHRYLTENREPTNEEARNYLVEKKNYLPAISSDAQYDESGRGENGFSYRISHRNVEKFRLIFLLKTPFVFSERGQEPIDAMAEWGERIAGLAKLLNVQFDKSCVDSSRLFYTPRHPEKPAAKPRIVIIAGNKLDIDTVDRIGTQNERNSPRNMNGEDEKSKKLNAPEFTEISAELKDWYRYCRTTFQFANLLEKIGKVRGKASGVTGLVIECLFDERHSNADDETDMACVAFNAGDGDNSDAFGCFCLHDSCQGRKPLEFVAKAIELGWITVNDLWSDDYNSKPQIKPASFDELSSSIAKLGDESPHEETEKVICKISRSNLSYNQETILKAKFIKKTGMAKPDLNNILQYEKNEIGKLNTQAQLDEMVESGLTVISLTPVDEHQWSEKTKHALVSANVDDPRLFIFTGRMSRVKIFETGNVSMEPLNEVQFGNEINHVTRWIFNEGGKMKIQFAPNNVVKHLYAEADPFLPDLKKVVSSPVFKADGYLLTKSGYDKKSQLFYAPPSSLKLRSVSEKPTSDELKEALDWLLNEALGDFCFSDSQNGKPSKAHALVMILLPFIREMITGSTPIHLISKPSPGTGASLLVDLFSIITTGQRASAKTETRDEEEFRKSLTATLMSGTPYYYLDNLHRKLDSAAFASVLTTGHWTDRLLGKSLTVDLPVRLQWILAGNNPRLSSELTRRSILIRLNAKTHDLTSRKFRHSNLPHWAEKERSNLVWSALTIIQNWIWKGKPKNPNSPLLPSFESWSETMAGILFCCGVEGFLENRKDLGDYADAEEGVIQELIQLWWDNYKNNPVQVGTGEFENQGLAGIVKEHEIMLPIKLDNYGNPNAKSLGIYLSSHRDQVFLIDDNNCKIKVILDIAGTTGGSKRWALNLLN